jgi:transcriptional regulator with XRE-family HTH domain
MKLESVPAEYQKKLDFIASMLREYRLNSGYSQNALIQELDLNLNRNTVSRAENGKNISLLSLFEIAATLEIDLKELFDDDEET